MIFAVILFFFFFQAEDGIRDLTVTGVQTCALPISTETNDSVFANVSRGRRSRTRSRSSRWWPTRRGSPASRSAGPTTRSEERRVGKECGSRWSPYDEKKENKSDV